jgi:hypothetical protein
VDSDLSEFHEESRVEKLQHANERLQAQLQDAKDRKADLVAAVHRAAQDAFLSMGPIPPVPKPDLKGGKGKPEVALWHLTDWQGGKRTLTYDSHVMQARVLHFVDVATQLTVKERSTHRVDDCVILLGGDLIEGLFNFPQQPFQVDQTIFGQYGAAGNLVVEVIRRALTLHRKVQVVAEWGNHGRIGDKRSAVTAADNFDRMILWHAQQILALDKSTAGRLTWQVGPEHSQPIEIGNYRAVLIHGDEFGKTGNVSWKTLVSKVVQWKSGAYKVNGEHWPFQDAYVGHYHMHREEPTPDGVGAVYGTGSSESDNGYAHDSLAAGGMPTQRLHFIDPERGRVGPQYKIWLPVKDSDA